MLITDAHLDLSYNALRGRNVLLPAAQQTPDAEGIPSVGLPDLAAGRIALICATIFCEPSLNGKPGYHGAQEAYEAAMAQLAWYQAQIAEGRMAFVKSAAEVPRDSNDATATATAMASAAPLRAILLLEGADALRSPDDIAAFVDAGMRIVGLAWRRTRYCGGTGEPGPLTSDGVALVKALDKAGIIHDASHLAEESFWQLLDITNNPIMASHSNCRSIVATDRQLSDDMIRAVAAHHGVIGINFFDKFLLPPSEYGKRRATLADVISHVRHICDLAGDANHVGIGTDMDGGLGRDQIPREITTSADLHKTADALATAGFVREEIEGIMGGNWARFFRQYLPGGSGFSGSEGRRMS